MHLLANNGEFEGVRLLSAESLARATTLQKPTGKLSVIPFDMRWRLGYHGVATTRGFPRQAFGHFGFGGSGAWADPSQELSVALIVNSGMGSPFGDMRTASIGGAALACARARSRSADLAERADGSSCKRYEQSFIVCASPMQADTIPAQKIGCPCP